jgi:hypothetical protein
MNDRQFDEFVAAVAMTSSRRQLLRSCAAAMLASMIGGMRRAIGAADILPAAQSADEPLPNFPFLAALPTDAGFEDYGLDVDLTGPPTRYRATDVLPSIPVDWLPIISQCRGAYAATIAKPKANAPHEPQRSVTTILFDLGTTAAATSTHANYVATVLANPLGQRLESTLSKTNRIVFVGCRGGCAGFRSPVASSETPSQEVAVVGHRDRFLFDTRIRDYGTQTITVAQSESVARRVDRNVRTATSTARTRSPLRAFTGGLKVALGGGAARVRSGARARAQQSTDDLRQRWRRRIPCRCSAWVPTIRRRLLLSG